MAKFMREDGYQIDACAMVVVQTKIERRAGETAGVSEIDVKSSANISSGRVRIGAN